MRGSLLFFPSNNLPSPIYRYFTIIMLNLYPAICHDKNQTMDETISRQGDILPWEKDSLIIGGNMRCPLPGE
jgi:hypothetical protein